MFPLLDHSCILRAGCEPWTSSSGSKMIQRSLKSRADRRRQKVGQVHVGRLDLDQAQRWFCKQAVGSQIHRGVTDYSLKKTKQWMIDEEKFPENPLMGQNGRNLRKRNGPPPGLTDGRDIQGFLRSLLIKSEINISVFSQYAWQHFVLSRHMFFRE